MAHSDQQPFTVALQRVIENAASWSDDYCYVCLSHAYTSVSPTVQGLDLISREVALHRHVDYREIRGDLDAAVSAQANARPISIGGLQYIRSGLLRNTIANIIRSAQFQEEPDDVFSDVPIEVRRYVIDYFEREYLAARTTSSCLGFNVSKYSDDF